MGKTVSELKGEIEKLEIDKDRLDEWFRNRTKEIDALHKKETSIRETAIIESASREKEKKEFEKLKAATLSEHQGLDRKKAEIEKGLIKLEEEKKSALDFVKAINERDEALSLKEKSILEREKFINEIFSGIVKLKGK